MIYYLLSNFRKNWKNEQKSGKRGCLIQVIFDHKLESSINRKVFGGKLVD